MFHRLNREEIRYYLDIRASQEFSVIQIAALAELDGFNEPNAYGGCREIDSPFLLLIHQNIL